ncbi:MAG: hypothetical protein ACI9U6_002414, partial [Loktanella salsilacus]
LAMRPTPPADRDRQRTPVRRQPPARSATPGTSHGNTGCTAPPVARPAARRNAERDGRQAAAAQASIQTASRCLPRRIPHPDRPYVGEQGEGQTGPFAGQAQRGKRGVEPGHKARRSDASGLTNPPADPAPARCPGRTGGASGRHAIQSRRLVLESLRGRIAPLFPMCVASLDGDAVGGGSAPMRSHANLGGNAVTDKFA